MQVTVRLFAAAAEAAGFRTQPLELPEGCRANQLLEALARRYPGLVPWTPRLVVAVNAEYAARETVLQEGDEVALIPPISGG